MPHQFIARQRVDVRFLEGRRKRMPQRLGGGDLRQADDPAQSGRRLRPGRLSRPPSCGPYRGRVQHGADVACRFQSKPNTRCVRADRRARARRGTKQFSSARDSPSEKLPLQTDTNGSFSGEPRNAKARVSFTYDTRATDEAERTGFEPAVRFDPYIGLANRRFRPLSHLSQGPNAWRLCADNWTKGILSVPSDVAREDLS